MAAEILYSSSVSYDIILGVATPSESPLTGPWVPNSKNGGLAQALFLIEDLVFALSML